MEFADSALDNIRSNLDRVFSAERRVAEVILKNPELVVTLNISDVAEQGGVSDATVTRLCKRLGYTGFYQMKLRLAHELGRNQLLRGQGKVGRPASTDDLLQELAAGVMSISQGVDMPVLTDCVERIRSAGTVYLAAGGNAVQVTEGLSFRLGRLGIRAISTNHPEQMIINISNGVPGDLVIGISHSGSSRQVINAFELAKKKGIATMALTDIKRSPAEQVADITLSTGVVDSNVFIFGATSYLFLYALTDLIVFFVEDARQGFEDEMVEYVLSDTKV